MTLSLKKKHSAANPPGAPGIQPTWSSSAKIGIGTAPTGDSNVWFSISHGIVNEVFFPRLDIANMRDMEFIVTDGESYFCEEKNGCEHEYHLIAEGIPAYRLINKGKEGRFQIEKKIITDPNRNVLLQHIVFKPLIGTLEDYKLYVLLAPHVANEGYGNHGWYALFKGTPMLFAEREGITLACAASCPFINGSVGFVGDNDPWHDLKHNFHLTQTYERASDGNLSLVGEVDLKACGGDFVLALGFGAHDGSAGIQARASLMRHFSWALRDYIEAWEEVQNQFEDLGHVDSEGGKLFRISTSVIKTHQGKHFSGSVIASLSIPWGNARTDPHAGGYHLIWPRDQVQTAYAFLAAGDYESAREVLLFLMTTQEENGHWWQCMWADGSAYWKGLQMDETALPILLADEMRRAKFLKGIEPWPMVQKATRFILQNGPITQQGRWEEDAGYNAYTVATEIAALLAAAEFYEEEHMHSEAKYLRETADWWNRRLDDWLYVKDSPLAKKCGVEGFYVRVAPQQLFDGTPNPDKNILIMNRPKEEMSYPYDSIVCVDAIALVRFGLRAADDPRMLNTIKVIDQVLKTNTKKGEIWHRYNEDGYGEHNDGRPYDGTGHGRAWPLLVGERAHYELSLGDRNKAVQMLRDMVNFAGEGGLIPEQIWDSKDIPERSLFNGHSSGSAKPLTWAHAEYITLLRSVRDGHVFGMPHQTQQRYLKDKTEAKIAYWTEIDRITKISKDQTLRIQTLAPCEVVWSDDGGKNRHKAHACDSGLGVYYVDIFAKGDAIEFNITDSKIGNQKVIIQ